MTYSMVWHPEYVAESVKRYELNKFAVDANIEWIEYAIECAQVVRLAKEVGEAIGDSKIVSIATTVLDAITAANAGGTRRSRSYRKITQPQRRALAIALIEKYASARGVAKHIWHLGDADIDSAAI